MASSQIPQDGDVAVQEKSQDGSGLVKTMTTEVAPAEGERSTPLVPLRMKLVSILLVTAVGFGSHWSSGVTGAMKSTLKKVTHHPSPLFPFPLPTKIGTLLTMI
jgi:hypothetical protein